MFVLGFSLNATNFLTLLLHKLLLLAERYTDNLCIMRRKTFRANDVHPSSLPVVESFGKLVTSVRFVQLSTFHAVICTSNCNLCNLFSFYRLDTTDR